MRARRAVTAGVAAVLVAAPLAVAGLVGSPQTVQDLLLSGGGAWLASPAQGLVTLVDGPTGTVAASAQVAVATALSVTQSGSSALVADGDAGTVSRVDGATLEVGTPVAFARPSSALSVLAGTGSVFVVDATQRIATVADAADLRVRDTLSLAAQPGPDQSLVDGDDRLWVVDSAGGGLRWFDADGGSGRAAAAADTRLVDVRGRAAQVDLGDSGAVVSWLGDDGPDSSWSCTLDARAGDDVSVLGSADDDLVFAAVSQAGTLLVAGTDDDDCGTVVPVAAPGSDFGALVQLDRFVFVPDRATGQTTVVDTRSRRVAASLPLTEQGNDLQLLSHDGIVFWNDLDSERAGVLRLGADGVWESGEAVSKYDPVTGAPTELVTPDDGGPVDVPDAADPPTEPPTTPTTPVGPTTPPTRPPGTQPTSPGSGSPGAPPTPTTPATGDPVPVITSITATTAVQAGSSATFHAEVQGATGSWSWSATDAGGATLGTASAEGDFTVALPRSVTGSITVRLVVGTSAPRTQQFTVGEAAPSQTVTTVTVTNAPLWGDEAPTIVVQVTSPDGRTPTGSVHLGRHETTIPPPDINEGDRTLVDGVASYTSFQVDRGVVTTIDWIATYTPDDPSFVASGSTTTTALVPLPFANSVDVVSCPPSLQVDIYVGNTLRADDLRVTAVLRNNVGGTVASAEMGFVFDHGGFLQYQVTFAVVPAGVDNVTFSYSSPANGGQRNDGGGWPVLDSC